MLFKLLPMAQKLGFFPFLPQSPAQCQVLRWRFPQTSSPLLAWSRSDWRPSCTWVNVSVGTSLLGLCAQQSCCFLRGKRYWNVVPWRPSPWSPAWVRLFPWVQKSVVVTNHARMDAHHRCTYPCFCRKVRQRNGVVMKVVSISVLLMKVQTGETTN